MSYDKEIKTPGKTIATNRPRVTSYDSCHEHSVEHWIEVRHMVEDFKNETTVAQPRIVAAGKKSTNERT